MMVLRPAAIFAVDRGRVIDRNRAVYNSRLGCNIDALLPDIVLCNPC